MLNNMEYMKSMTEKREYTENTYNKINIWGSGKKSTYRNNFNEDNKWNERIYNTRYNRIIQGIENEEDYWDFSEYIRDHRDY